MGDNQSGNRDLSIMDTTEFIALNAQYLSQSGTQGQQAGSQAASKGQARSSQKAGGAAPANPLVAARVSAGNTYAGGTKAGVDGLYPIAEQAHAKEIDIAFNKRRRTGKVIIIVVIIVAILVAIACGAFFYLKDQASKQAQAGVSAAWASIEAADQVIDPLSDAMAQEINGGTLSPDVSSLMTQYSSQVTTNLNDASQSVALDSISARLVSDEDKAAINAVSSAIDARRSLVSVARELLLNDTKLNDATTGALTLLNSVYVLIGDARTQIANSTAIGQAYVDALNAEEDTSAFNLADAVAADAAAVQDIVDAQTAVAAAKQVVPDADYAGLDAYLAAALTAYNAAQTLDTDVMNDVDATASNDAYVAATDAMAAAEAALPADGMAVLSGWYAALTSGQAGTFSTALSNIETQDAAVTSYLQGKGLLTSAPTDDSAGTEASADSGETTPEQASPADAAV